MDTSHFNATLVKKETSGNQAEVLSIFKKYFNNYVAWKFPFHSITALLLLALAGNGAFFDNILLFFILA